MFTRGRISPQRGSRCPSAASAFQWAVSLRAGRGTSRFGQSRENVIGKPVDAARAKVSAGLCVALHCGPLAQIHSRAATRAAHASVFARKQVQKVIARRRLDDGAFGHGGFLVRVRVWVGQVIRRCLILNIRTLAKSFRPSAPSQSKSALSASAICDLKRSRFARSGRPRPR